QYGKYLTFRIADNVYGIPIRCVREIIGIQDSTRVPGTPDYVKGIINLRGKIIPLVDIRLKFGKEEISYDERTCVIVVEAYGMAVGFIVDHVEDVLTIVDENISPLQITAEKDEDRYVEAIGTIGEQVQLLLDVERLIKGDELPDSNLLEEGHFQEDV
ncbi:MAG: chemotaxis protein CheW, partial [Clostridiales Family XIII bacterium]|nr:chemotaxis protein CheW [Clostridiales Family XIII bacterium]